MNNYTLITGGSNGIGFELAKQFASNGHNLILVARDLGELENAAQELKNHDVDIVTLTKDLFKPDGAQELYDEIKEKGLHVNILVNNAGQGQYGKFTDSELKDELEIIQLNIFSLVTLTKLYLKEMVKRNEGRILNLSSIAGKVPGPYHAVYHGTKAFVQSFTHSVRSEISDSEVTITALLPGATDTDFFNKAEMQDSKITEQDLDNPEQVAKDGYEALMSGDDEVISGFMNKVNIGMNKITSDRASAKMMKKMQKPKDKEKR